VRPTDPETLSAVAPVPASRDGFEEFVREAEPQLRRALVAAYGSEAGRDAAAEALAYAWEHWERLRSIKNLPGYLYRVGQSRSRRRRPAVLFETPGWPERNFEPGLPGALAALSVRQRQAVVLVYGYGCTAREVSELIGIKQTTVHNHVRRGLERLRKSLGVSHDD
jgi:DNA-directed RNA polymerase specialized sigma24 family protein